MTELLIPGISEVPEETCNKLAQLAIQSKYTDYRSMRLLYYLVMALEPKTVVELGTFLGASTAHLAAVLNQVLVQIRNVFISTMPMKAVKPTDFVWIAVVISAGSYRPISRTLRVLLGMGLIPGAAIEFMPAIIGYHA